jgi:hypothetical protein
VGFLFAPGFSLSSTPRCPHPASVQRINHPHQTNQRDKDERQAEADARNVAEAQHGADFFTYSNPIAPSVMPRPIASWLAVLNSVLA